MRTPVRCLTLTLTLTLAAVALSACVMPRASRQVQSVSEFLVSPVRESAHRGHDDLLSAGLGLSGLRAPAVPFAQADTPTPDELRRRAIWTAWRGIADLGPLGGYGEIYGAAPAVPGRELQAFAHLDGAHFPHRVLVQLPDAFDSAARCVVVAASSGSRGVYGSIALAGAWGLPRGCAVAYTDKGTGPGYFDLASRSGVRLDGSRGEQNGQMLEFAPESATATGTDIAVKHAHSGDNPEADWGRHVLQTTRFALAMLDRAYPRQAPFAPSNTTVIAVGVSNGGGAALQAAGLDAEGLLDGVVALAPNVLAGEGGRALYDYTTQAALLHACALLDPRYAEIPFARLQGLPSPLAQSRCSALAAQGVLPRGETAVQAAAARDHLLADGWTDAAMTAAASSSAFDLWRAVAVTYASSYTRAPVGSMPCGYAFAALDTARRAKSADTSVRAAWWSDASGIPPGAGVDILDTRAGGSDGALPGLECLRALWTNSDVQSSLLHRSIEATRAQLPRQGLPVMVVHGVDDGLIPEAFSSAPYVQWLRAQGRRPVHWQVMHAQHFDAFLALPGFGDRYVPLVPYGYRALDRLAAHLQAGAPLPDDARIAARARGASSLSLDALALP